MSLEIIRAAEADRAFLLALRKLTMVEHLERAGLHLSNDDHEFRLDDAYECSHLIMYSGHKIGMLKYRELTDKIEVMQLQIHPESQGKGVGAMVMERVLGWSKARHKKLVLSVLKTSPAKAFYERLGFSIIGQDEHEFYMELGF